MSVAFYEPFFTVSDFDRLFEEAFSARTDGKTHIQRQSSDSQPRFLRPRMDLHEDAQNNLVTATFELPGLKKKDVQIDVQNGQVTVSGESKMSSERDENGYAVRERRYGRFARNLQLPQGINPDEIKASMENGVLTITFPKSSPELAPRRIVVA